MNRQIATLLGVSGLFLGAQAQAQVTFYEGEDFHGRALTTNQQVPDFKRSSFNDRASSVIVEGGRWEVCEDANFRGKCVVLREGNYDSLGRLGVNDRLSSARRVNDRDRRDGDRNERFSPEPQPEAAYEYRRRPHEQVYEARVTSVRAVMGQSTQRCWVERGQIEQRGGGNVAGGLIGGIIGGVLGHQIGNGNGIATAGGAVAGAAIGANAGRGREEYGADVRRCESSQTGTPEYWDVRYTYRNTEHRIQMSAPPGRTVYVNRQGEPRQ